MTSTGYDDDGLPIFDRDDPRIRAALAELQGIIVARYPEATFEVFEGEDPEGIYLDATVDIEDRGEVIDLVVDRMVDIQVDDGLPVYVVVSRPPERVVAMPRGASPVRRLLNVEDVLAAPPDQVSPPAHRAASGG